MYFAVVNFISGQTGISVKANSLKEAYEEADRAVRRLYLKKSFTISAVQLVKSGGDIIQDRSDNSL